MNDHTPKTDEKPQLTGIAGGKPAEGIADLGPDPKDDEPADEPDPVDADEPGQSVNLGAVKVKDAKAIGALTSTMLTLIGKGRDALHDWATQSLGHAANTGDRTLFTRGIAGLLSGKTSGGLVNLRGLVYAVEQFTPLTVNLRSGEITYHRAHTKRGQMILAKRPVLWDIEAFAASPFWTMQAVRDSAAIKVRAFDSMAIIKSVANMKQSLTDAIAGAVIDDLQAERAEQLLTAIEGAIQASGLGPQLKVAEAEAVERADQKAQKRAA